MFVGWYRYHQSREEKTTNLLPIIKGNQMKAQPIAGPIPNLTVRPNKHAEPMERPRAAVAAGFRIPPSTTRHPRASGGPLGRERERERQRHDETRGGGGKEIRLDSLDAKQPATPPSPSILSCLICRVRGDGSTPTPTKLPPRRRGGGRRCCSIHIARRPPSRYRLLLRLVFLFPIPPPRICCSSLPSFLPPTRIGSDRIGGGCCCCGLLRLLCNCNSARIGCAAVASVSRLGSIAWSHPFQPVPGNSPPLLFVWLWPIVKRRLAIPPPFVWPIYTKHDAQLLNLLPVSDRCCSLHGSKSHLLMLLGSKSHLLVLIKVEISSSHAVKVEIHLLILLRLKIHLVLLRSKFISC